MAMTFHSIERLGSPFASVSELGLEIPVGGEVRVDNPERKLLFFLRADCIQEIERVGVFHVRAGDVFVVPRRCAQHYRAGGRGPGQSTTVHALKILFSLPPLPAPGERRARLARVGDPEADFTAFVRHHFREIRHLPAAQNAPMQEIMRAIRREAEEHPAGIRHRVRALCINLVVHVARMLHETPPAARDTAVMHGPLVNQTKEFLLRNFARELTLGEIAWHVKKSEEHLARVFRKVTGQTVFDYLRAVRLENAKTLLINSEKSLTEIAARTGFSTLALFSRNFSHYVGRSPSAYRQERAQGVHWVDASGSG
ncbi:MAG: helix-turn-helix transcriptional regulator [Opitutaceae bacterium]